MLKCVFLMKVVKFCTENVTDVKSIFCPASLLSGYKRYVNVRHGALSVSKVNFGECIVFHEINWLDHSNMKMISCRSKPV